MNWGHKITLVYIGFVVFMLFLVVKSVMQKDIFLVSENYYEDEIAYEDKLNRMRNVKTLSEPVSIEEKSDTLTLFLAKESEKGKGFVTFYRPSDKNMDFKLPLQVESNGFQKIYTGKYPKGLWTVKINWEIASKEYYLEKKIQI
ncbi:MAG: FixH family protein [Cytophagaceae bacterium]|nr:FixH family protein [Cytophagaceae bacterium]